MSIFDFLWVRNLSMWVACGITTLCILLLEVDTLGSGPLIFEGAVFYLMVSSLALPCIVVGVFVYDFVDVIVSTAIGYVLAILGFSIYMWQERAGSDFASSLFTTLFVVKELAPLIVPLVFCLALCGFFGNRIYRRYGRRLFH